MAITQASLQTDAEAQLQQGITALENHQLAEAAVLFQQVLQSLPDHPAANYWLGMLLFQQGMTAAGISQLKYALARHPDCCVWHNDLGNMHAMAGQAGEAALAFIAALECNPNQSLVWNNLGAVLQRLARLDDAVVAYENAISLDAANADALNNLANAQHQLGFHLQAGQNHCRAFVMLPHTGKSRQMLATAYYILGEIDLAAEMCRQWLQEEPDHPIAIHMLAGFTATDVPERAGDAYLQQYFDQAAEQFEHKMRDTLCYRVPEQFGQLLQTLSLGKCTQHILDAGCGTGLCGPWLAPLAHSLIGIDLSAKSLALAKQKNCYTHLQQVEITRYLRQQPAKFDLIIAADTLIYFGNLDPLIRLAAQCLIPGGRLLVSIETLNHPSSYAITPSGRYAHRCDYIQQTMLAANLQIECLVPIELRVELGQAVDGWMVLAQKCQG